MRVGPLFHAIGQLIESDAICDFDINADGELSQEEVAIYMLGFYFKSANDKMPIEQLVNNFNSIPNINQNWKSMTTNLGTSKVSPSCMLKIDSKFNCKKNESNNLNKCVKKTK